MQFQQQKLGSMLRVESSSSLRSSENAQLPLVVQQKYATPMDNVGSLTSGSYLSSRTRSQTGSIGNTYQNIIKNAKQSEASRFGLATTRFSGSGTRTNSVSSYQPSTLIKSSQGARSIYAPSYLKMSRSLKASQASLATYKSGRTTIQAEHHDRKVQREINSVKFGRARKLYWIAVGFYIMFLVVLFVGLLITCLRHVYMNIILSLDVGELTGPLLIACSFLFFGAGMKFYVDACRLGSEERKRIKYKAASPSTVTVTTTTQRLPDNEEKLVSGQTSQNALSRAPIGSRNTLVLP